MPATRFPGSGAASYSRVRERRRRVPPVRCYHQKFVHLGIRAVQVPQLLSWAAVLPCCCMGSLARQKRLPMLLLRRRLWAITATPALLPNDHPVPFTSWRWRAAVI